MQQIEREQVILQFGGNLSVKIDLGNEYPTGGRIYVYDGSTGYSKRTMEEALLDIQGKLGDTNVLKVISNRSVEFKTK